MIKVKKEAVFFSFAAFVVAAMVLMIESPSTCFLYPHFWGTDSSIFQYIGRVWDCEGVPYRDAFDHKGPLLFLLNRLGFQISGDRYGILFIQILFLTAALVMLYKTLRLRYRFWGTVAITAVFLAVFCYFSSEGNLTEEYSIALSMPGIYYVLKYYGSEESEHNPVWSLIYGICFGCMLMMRVNNAVPMLGLIFGIFINLILSKKGKNLLRNIWWGCVGIGIVVIPFWVYFAAYGVGNEMWNATLFFNLKYSGDSLNWNMDRETIYLILQYSAAALVTAVAAVIHFIKFRDTLSVGCMTGIAISELLLISGRRYKHYFMIYTVLIPVLFYLLYDIYAAANRIIGIGVICLCTGILLSAGEPVKKIKNDIIDAYRSIERDGRTEGSLCNSGYEIYDKIAGLIPEEERISVAGYNIPAGFWLETGIDSCYRYFVFNDMHGRTDETVRQDMTATFLNGNAKWIVAEGEILNEDISNHIADNYEIIFEENGILLYHNKT